MRQFLANTWEGSVVKIATGAALGAVLSWLMTADVHPLIVAVGAAVLPVFINYLNGADHRYGRNKDPQPVGLDIEGGFPWDTPDD